MSSLKLHKTPNVNEPTPYERKIQRDVDRLMGIWGRYESVQRFVRKINKTTTKMAYLSMFNQYFA